MAGGLTISTLNDSSGVLATQNGMKGIAKAWANFSGGGGGVTVNGSFNISSITRTSAGIYVANYTTAMPSATYAVMVTSDFGGTTTNTTRNNSAYNLTTTSCGIRSWYYDSGGNANNDPSAEYFVVFSS